jgi:hypothetical protein
MGTASVNVGLSIALFDYQRVIPQKRVIYFYISFGTFDRLLKGVIPKFWVFDWFGVGFLKMDIVIPYRDSRTNGDGDSNIGFLFLVLGLMRASRFWDVH